MHKETKMNVWLKPATAMVIWMLFVLIAMGNLSASPVIGPLKFETPDAAVAALQKALKDNDQEAMKAIFGTEYADRLLAQDKAAAREGRERLYQAAQQALTLRKDRDDRVVLVIGPEDWPFPVPLVLKEKTWSFNTAEGFEEIMNRRIGGNERQAITVCQAYLYAQREYAGLIRDNSGVRKFAQRLISSSGKQDGLYWDPATAGGEVSPFGPLVAEYLGGGRKPGDPYYGYYFRVLTRQGKRAPGGPYNYVINGNMIGGFAMVAFPAEYGKTGIMTFLVSHHGKILQKDLGPKTLEITGRMKNYNPDSTWTEVKE